MAVIDKNTTKTLREMEDRLWLEGETAYRELARPDIRIAFPMPIGLRQGIERVVEGLSQQPSWSRLERHSSGHGVQQNTAVVHYEVTAFTENQDEDPQHFLVSSTWQISSKSQQWELISRALISASDGFD